MPLKLARQQFPLLQLLFSLGVNLYTLLGIIIWNWSFFVVIYLYWAEEVARIIFAQIENRMTYKREWISKEAFEWRRDGFRKAMFPMFIYFVFIVVIVGFVASPDTDDKVITFQTLFFKNTEFNLNLLFAILSEGIILYLFIRKNSKSDKVSLNVGHVPKSEEENSTKNGALSPQAIVLHLSIILGTLLYFAANTDRLPIQIDLGRVGIYAFPIVFTLLQVGAEIFVFFDKAKKDET